MKPAQPNPSELSILKALWHESPLSAKEIHEKIVDELDWSFSSTRKTLERMVDKSLLTTELVHGVKVFVPAVEKVKTLADFVRDFQRRILDMDSPLPVAAFAKSKLLNKQEINELKKILEEKQKS